MMADYVPDRRCLILYLKDIFEEHVGIPLNAKDISTILELKCGLSIKRGTLYKYIEALRDYGMIIDLEQGRGARYTFVGPLVGGQ